MMYEDILYVAGPIDEANFRELLLRLKLHVLPERPGAPAGLTQAEIGRNPRRLLSLKPIAEVALDLKPFPHYSPAVAPLLDWGVPSTQERLLLVGSIRHHRYMEKKGPEYQKVGTVFVEIKKWMKLNWKPMSQADFMGPEASGLVAQGYAYSSFDPAKTSFTTIDRSDK